MKKTIIYGIFLVLLINIAYAEIEVSDEEEFYVGDGDCKTLLRYKKLNLLPTGSLMVKYVESGCSIEAFYDTSYNGQLNIYNTGYDFTVDEASKKLYVEDAAKGCRITKISEEELNKCDVKKHLVYGTQAPGFEPREETILEHTVKPTGINNDIGNTPSASITIDGQSFENLKIGNKQTKDDLTFYVYDIPCPSLVSVCFIGAVAVQEPAAVQEPSEPSEPSEPAEPVCNGCLVDGTCIFVGIRTEDQYCSMEKSMENLKSEEEQCNNDYECINKFCSNRVCKKEEESCAGCLIADTCLSLGMRTGEGYCDISKQIKPQKLEGAACNNYFECLINLCTDGVCKEPCAGCLVNDTCLSFGMRTENQYCSEKLMENLKSEEEQCNNNFECSSNICVNNQCISPGLIQRIIDWLRGFFGG